MGLTNNPDTDTRILSEFEKYGISYEAAIEECVKDLEYSPIRIIHIICNGDIWDVMVSAVKRKVCMAITDQYIDKIRSCGNWQELYDEMHQTSEFQKNMKKKIKEEMKI